MKRIGLLLLTAVLTLGSSGCEEDKKTGGTVYATEDTPGTTPSPVPPPPESGPPAPQEITIAKCLSSKGAVLYGASWCTYTKKQIASFKDGFRYLNYVECTEQSAVCKENGISGYPTWIVGGSRISGYRAPTVIGAAAGCSW